MSEPDGVDPIVVAGDDGEILDESADGAIECVEDDDGEGMTVRVDPDTELGERIAWAAGHHGETPAEFVREAAQEFIDEQRGDGGQEPTVRCPNCGHEFGRDEATAASFDGDEARWQCPDCGEWTEGLPPG